MPRELPVEVREQEGDVPGMRQFEPWTRTANDSEYPVEEPPTDEEMDAMYEEHLRGKA